MTDNVKAFERIAQEQADYWKKRGVPDMQSRMVSWCEAVEAIGEDAMEEYCDHMPDSSIKTRGGK